MVEVESEPVLSVPLVPLVPPVPSGPVPSAVPLLVVLPSVWGPGLVVEVEVWFVPGTVGRPVFSLVVWFDVLLVELEGEPSLTSVEFPQPTATKTMAMVETMECRMARGA
ncbi:MAG: hypothetical protein AAF799_16755 [Myxococcota bacterium]